MENIEIKEPNVTIKTESTSKGTIRATIKTTLETTDEDAKKAVESNRKAWDYLKENFTNLEVI